MTIEIYTNSNIKKKKCFKFERLKRVRGKSFQNYKLVYKIKKHILTCE